MLKYRLLSAAKSAKNEIAKNLPSIVLTRWTWVPCCFDNDTHTPNDGKYEIKQNENKSCNFLASTKATGNKDEYMEEHPDN